MNAPKEFPGLAHLCEHMMFKGTNTFNSKNEYSQFIIENGGYINAETINDSTKYYFDIKNDAFEESLKRLQYTFFGFFKNKYVFIF